MPEIIDTDRSFYHQSIWMVFAAVVASVFSFGVNMVAPWMTMAEYGLMATLLQSATLMMIPAMGLQAVFAMQGASSDSLQESEDLAKDAMAGILLTSLLWIVLAALSFRFRADIYRSLDISSAPALWVTVCLGLPQLWLPILMGILQGRQNFRWLGWAMIANGVGRFSGVVFIVLILGGQATGGMIGILLGTACAFTICTWHTRDIWIRRFSGFQWQSWLGRILPLTFGLGSVQYMMSVDMIFARTRFESSQTGLYAVAGVFARGLVILTGPIVAVMFPKVVSSLKRAIPTKAFGNALKLAAMLAGTAAVICTIGAWITPGLLAYLTEPDSVLSAVHRAALAQHTGSLSFIADLIPWFVWSMLPLALANVMVAYVVARRLYRHIAGLGLVACFYTLTLSIFSGSMTGFIRIIGFFNLLFLLLSAAVACPSFPYKQKIFGLLSNMQARFKLFRKRPRPSVAGSQQPEALASTPAPCTSCPICPICASPATSMIQRDHPGYMTGTFFNIYRCLECDTHFIDPMRIQPNVYDLIYSTDGIIGYDRYIRYFSQVLKEKNPLRFLASKEAGYYVLYEHLRDKSKLRILDVGCGYGYLTYALRQQGFEAFGLDVSEAALNIAQARFGNYFHHSDIKTFAAVQSQPYDLIVALELIEHLADPVPCLNTLLQLLSPGGILLLTTPNRDYYGVNAVWHTELPPVHTMWLCEKSVLALAARAGCGLYMKTLIDWYPEKENKLAKYLGSRMEIVRTPALTDGMHPALGADHSDNKIRKIANWTLHEVSLIRVPCNFLHNRFLQVDDTLAWLLWNKDVSS
jgi:SAM-dependent methyltransferase/O-antigen/teichoic acid export membrane protein